MGCRQRHSVDLPACLVARQHCTACHHSAHCTAPRCAGHATSRAKVSRAHTHAHNLNGQSCCSDTPLSAPPEMLRSDPSGSVSPAWSLRRALQSAREGFRAAAEPARTRMERRQAQQRDTPTRRERQRAVVYRRYQQQQQQARAADSQRVAPGRLRPAQELATPVWLSALNSIVGRPVPWFRFATHVPHGCAHRCAPTHPHTAVRRGPPLSRAGSARSTPWCPVAGSQCVSGRSSGTHPCHVCALRAFPRRC